MPHESTRRSFVGAGAAALTSGVASARPAIETLAISGGPKAVTVPADRQAEISKWPHYGEEEKRVILELLDSNKSYGEWGATLFGEAPRFLIRDNDSKYGQQRLPLLCSLY